MIPTAFLQAWSIKAPWPDLRQVEQDLIISRALCDLFNAPTLKGKLAFRGGTYRRDGRRGPRSIVVVWKIPEGTGGSLDAPGVQVRA